MSLTWSFDRVIDLLCNEKIAAAIVCAEASSIHFNLGSSSRTSIAALFQHALATSCLIYLLYSLYRATTRSTIDWTDQLAIVTGSSGGLGNTIVSELRSRGCRVAAVDIRQNQRSSDDIGLLSLQGDVSNLKTVQGFKGKIKKHFDCSVTIVISNAGVMIGKKVLDFDEGQFEQTIGINLLATYYLVKTFLPDMLATGQGHIVAVSSIMGYISISQLTDYVASKHALVGFLESLQYELDKKYHSPRIKTTLLILGKLSTPLFARTKILPLSEFLTPTQEPARVAKALIDKIERKERGALYMPYLARLAPVLKAFPDWVRGIVQRASGADEALQEQTLQ